MARNARKSTRSKSGGSTLFGLLAGLIIGLAAAVAVALFVTKAPMPFADKASRDPAKTLLPDVRDAPDPNNALYRSGNQSPEGPVDTRITPPPVPDSGVASMADDMDRLIASLSKEQQTTKPPAPPPPPAAPPASAQTTYYLQAGAFRSENDAEAMKARILMLGMATQVQKAQVNGGTIYRVRVGPFKGIDEMNRSRAQLGEEKIESAVVRP